MIDNDEYIFRYIKLGIVQLDTSEKNVELTPGVQWKYFHITRGYLGSPEFIILYNAYS